MSDFHCNSVDSDVIYEYENISANQIIGIRNEFRNQDNIRRNDTELSKQGGYNGLKDGIVNTSEVNTFSRNVNPNKRGGKLKPRHVPDFVLISPDDVDRLISSVTTLDERKTIINNYELGTIVLRRLCISESSEIKAFMDSIQMRTTGKALESHERNIICLTFRGQPKRWVFCPCRSCLFKGKAHDKLMGHFKIMEQDAQTNKFQISKNVYDSYGVFMASCGYFAATFCPQQNYSSHKVFVGPTISDLKGRIHDRYILFINESKVIHMAWRRKQNYTFDCEELLSNVMSKLMVCGKSSHVQMLNQLSKGYSGLMSLPLKLRFHCENLEKQPNSISSVNEFSKEGVGLINKKNKRKTNKRNMEDWDINSDKFLSGANELQNAYNKSMGQNLTSKSYSFPNSPIVRVQNSQYYNSDNNSLTPRCTKQYISESSHDIEGETLTSNRYGCIVGDVSTASATPIAESADCIMNKQFNYNSKILDCIQTMNKSGLSLNDMNRGIYASASLDPNSFIPKVPIPSSFLSSVNQSKILMNNIDMHKADQCGTKPNNKNWLESLEGENENPNIKQLKENYIYGDFSQGGIFRSHFQQNLINEGAHFSFNPLAFSSDSATNSMLQSETIEEESMNKQNFNNGFIINGITTNQSISLYRQVFSPNEITTPNSTLEISSPIQQIQHSFIPDGIVQDQSSQINIIQQVQNIVNPGAYSDVFGEDVAQCASCEHCSMVGYPYYCNCYKIPSESATSSNVIDVNDTTGVFQLNNQYIHASHEVDS
ncbi:uncharacterized protein ELE39_002859 [Cryptosporidium sp. chipmunk genotype I]|uniref:uncharacterized protein n=1 Tax=Cryptosporidium sp. chipmunk genotype I TaxID=1280935 RepID=UPI00351A05C0|nr:hypothetical protein ELE39_002859 [Cryptosporidium sp. chipmunk genotype I]